MRQTVRLGHLHGIALGLHWSALLLLGLLAEVLATTVLPSAAPGYSWAGYWLAGFGFAALFLAALLAHEYAHARVAQHHGISVRSITLWMLGGVSELEGEPRRPRTLLHIALAGPATSLALAGAFLAAVKPLGALGSTLLEAGFAWLAIFNATIAVFNLLPAAPLDGGRVLEAVLWRIRGDRSAARRAATHTGVAAGLLLMSVGLVSMFTVAPAGGLWLLLVGWYLTVVARTEGSASGVLERIGDLRAEQLMSAPAVCGHLGQTVDAFIAEVGVTHPHHRYPVVDLDGHLAGLVMTRGLGRVPPARRPEVRLGEVMVPVAQVRTAARDAPVRDGPIIPMAPLGIIVVLDGGRPCGVLTSGDLRRAVVVAEAGGRPDRSRGPLGRSSWPVP
ncbi:site-2 protease family protein [Actinoplanes sp. LDG1-06]|uniref:Zinc metalloprotease n=1 Tax=Paractinoplanes ovalisporus TaxID=2810368 RepID=A0ABS2A952_9ACTN|nr:site-2 protease family protein [Actinoplanes ovalisporus]MBM2616347.1 site-2 protease family protein [Actinoplanes ovalisporus]